MRRLALPVLPLLLATATKHAEGATVSGSLAAEGEGPFVVYVEKVPGKPGAKRNATIAQKAKTFQPAGVVVTVGSRVDFPNEDKYYHNVFSPTPGSQFDLGLYRLGVSKSVTLQKSGEIEVFCNIHPEMVARILVVENEFFVRARPGATFEIKDLPAGTFDIVAWSPTHEPQRKSIKVSADGRAEVGFQLKPRGSKSHPNKDGESYGRYK